MSVPFVKSPAFIADVGNQFEWYWDEAGKEIAWRFHKTVDATLLKLTQQPEIGRKRKFRHSGLQGLRSFRLDPPFQKLLIFYRCDEGRASAVRLMHGSRDLGRRLVESVIGPID